MATGLEIVTAARSWLGTGFVHAAAAKGFGCDCLGLILGVAREVGLTAYVPKPYSRDIPVDWMRRELDRLLVPVPVAQPGDVLLFRVRSVPIHLAYKSSSTHMIHAHEWTPGSGAVIETPLDRFWRRQQVGAWRWPGVEG
jgi:NlpC/P60 family putative phage cell wall peptidase